MFENLLYVMTGFAVVVTAIALGISIYVALTVSAAEARQSTRRVRIAYRIGWLTIVLSIIFVGVTVVWAIGQAILGRGQ